MGSASPLASLAGFFVFVFVDRNGIEILCFKHLSAIEAADIIDTVAAVKELGPLVLTTLHTR
jgi:hypothetical protein